MLCICFFPLFLPVICQVEFQSAAKPDSIWTSTDEVGYHSATIKSQQNESQKISRFPTFTDFREKLLVNLDKRMRFECKTVVIYGGNPSKMVSIHVGELLYTNSSPMIPMMLT